VFSIGLIWLDRSRSPGKSIWDDLTNGNPKRGELGLGRFVIYGITYPFEYPFRLAVRTIPSAVTPWLCYIPHQAGQWFILFKAKQAKKRGELQWTDSDVWNPYAWAMFQWNLFFVFVHVLQTQYFYDGLAATFPEISTLFAGVSSILVAFVFEVRRRGFAFTWTPSAWRESLFELADIFKQYHGYLACFGITLTFWYHTMESTFAHLTGFIHIFLLLWQSSLIYQKSHRNRYWTLLLEMWILLHGSVVAYYQGILEGGLHLMFLTSFTFLFIMGPMWGIPFIKRFTDEDPKRKNFRVILLLIPTLITFSIWCVYKFNAIGKLYLTPMFLALPGLYYGFLGWYFMFYAVGKRLELQMSGKWGIVRKSKLWWSILSVWGFLSCASIMFIAEFIYRQFVPYSRGP
jgi:hypothetical protein